MSKNSMELECSGSETNMQSSTSLEGMETTETVTCNAGHEGNPDGPPSCLNEEHPTAVPDASSEVSFQAALAHEIEGLADMEVASDCTPIPSLSTAHQMDPESVRDPKLGTQNSAAAKSKRKQSRSPAGSSNSGSLLLYSPEEKVVEVIDKLDGVSVSSTKQVAAEGDGDVKKKNKRKNKKKKKKCGETSEQGRLLSTKECNAAEGQSVEALGSKVEGEEMKPTSAVEGQSEKVGSKIDSVQVKELNAVGKHSGTEAQFLPPNMQSIKQHSSKKYKQPQQVMQSPQVMNSQGQIANWQQLTMQPPFLSKNDQQGGKNHRGKNQMLSAQQQQVTMPQQKQGQHSLSKQFQQGKRGNNSAQRDKRSQNQAPKKNIFEPHWSKEAVDDGLEKGILFQGPIRINPRNFEDAYLPLPDGITDIYISGMADRNRALNGDIVAVLVQNQDMWRVFTNEIDEYERDKMPQGAESCGQEEQSEGSSSADVIVEEEEEVELDSLGKPIEGTQVTRPGCGAVVSSATGSKTPGQNNSNSQQKNNQGKTRGCESQCASKAKRYVSVKEFKEQASPEVKRLLDDHDGLRKEDGGEKREINSDRFMQRTGKVVHIIEKKHSRAGSGNLRPLQNKNQAFATFSPCDARVPRMLIPVNELPDGFKDRPEDFTKVLFIARIQTWNETSKMPIGELIKSLGEAGQLEPETEGLLLENSVDSSDFSDEVLACLPKQSPWTIPIEEVQSRRDLRKECVFSIDPATARDLDDALHCTDLGDGTYEVGVHIADVSYFVEENSELDREAERRATSVYLVQKVVPMLPRLLCEQLCSLNPDEDRLSFSVIWILTEDGKILDEWFGRTVIRSCVKLSYDHAQGFIDQPDRQWTVQELPPISKGFTVEDIKSRVLNLDQIAKAMRKFRYDNGALRLDQVKLQFSLNQETGLPNGYHAFQQRDSNKLVEEFMLLANMAVAEKIKGSHKDHALLRCHPNPQPRMIEDLKQLCSSLEFPIEVGSAKEIQLSLARYAWNDDPSRARLQVLVALCSRPMRNAKYFCCGMVADEQLYHHYALNVPFYTHFTSPIRRYPDILVHRTLAAALGCGKLTDRSSEEIHKIADYCNTKKTNAKQCSEKSIELFFAIFVKEAGPLEQEGMVMQVLDKSFDVYMLKLGVVKRVYCEKLPLEKFSHRKEGKKPLLTLVWKADDRCPRIITQKISIFTAVHCTLQSEPEPLKWSASIHRPEDTDPSIVQ